MLSHRIVRIESGDHACAKFLCGNARILGKCGESRRVIPSISALRFLRRKEVVCVWLQSVNEVKILHQASIKSDQIKLHAAIPDCFYNFAGRHFFLVVRSLVELLRAIPMGKAAAVIPQNQHIAVCGIVLLCPANEVFQRLFFRHTGGRSKIQYLLYFAIADRIAGVRAILHASRKHALCSSHFKYDRQSRALFGRIPDLLNIDRRQSSVRLQVCCNNILHDDNALVTGVVGIEIVSLTLCRGRLDRFRVHDIFTAHDRPLLRDIAHLLIRVFDQILDKRSGHILPD